MIDIEKFRNYAEQIYQHTWPKHLSIKEQDEHLYLGLLSELGELLGAFTGHIDKEKFKPNYSGYLKDKIIDELGDCLYYVTINLMIIDNGHSLNIFSPNDTSSYDFTNTNVTNTFFGIINQVKYGANTISPPRFTNEFIYLLNHILDLLGATIDINNLIDYNLQKLLDTNNRNKNGWVKNDIT